MRKGLVLGIIAVVGVFIAVVDVITAKNFAPANKMPIDSAHSVRMLPSGLHKNSPKAEERAIAINNHDNDSLAEERSQSPSILKNIVFFFFYLFGATPMNFHRIPILGSTGLNKSFRNWYFYQATQLVKNKLKGVFKKLIRFKK
ncbi:hypothetical protein Plhal703r1_c06g0035931 [Plasmopara halstedii]